MSREWVTYPMTVTVVIDDEHTEEMLQEFMTDKALHITAELSEWQAAVLTSGIQERTQTTFRSRKLDNSDNDHSC